MDMGTDMKGGKNDGKRYGEQKAALEDQKKDLVRLISEKEKEIETQIRAAGEEGNTLDMNHPADMVSPDQDHEKAINLLHRSRTELAMVNHALARIESGDYGECEECGMEINHKRLLAIPYTRYCIDCSKELEELDERPDWRDVRQSAAGF